MLTSGCITLTVSDVCAVAHSDIVFSVIMHSHMALVQGDAGSGDEDAGIVGQQGLLPHNQDPKLWVRLLPRAGLPPTARYSVRH